MEEEITALEANDTWTIENLPLDKIVIGCMWVFRIKRKFNGSVERYKARLVIFGNRAPTVKMVTIRVFLTIAAVNNWKLHQIEVHNAFLHGDLVDEVYICVYHLVLAMKCWGRYVAYANPCMVCVRLVVVGM